MDPDNQKLWYLKRIQRKVGKTVGELGLLNPGDRILIGLSGGKDSLVLLHSLKTRSINFPFVLHIEAAYVDTINMPYEIDTDFLTRFCDNLEVPFSIIKTSFNIEKESNKQTCFICSWNRRKELFNFAQKKGCNKVALGHHKDDIVQTLIMNMAFQGSISTMPPRLKIFDGLLEIIRPLAQITEDECREYASIAEFPDEKKLCPHGDDTKRKQVKEAIEILLKFNPDARNNLYNSMSNIQEEYLPGWNIKDKDLPG